MESLHASFLRSRFVMISTADTYCAIALASATPDAAILLGDGVIWFTYGISECAVFILAVTLLKFSERNGIVFKNPQY